MKFTRKGTLYLGVCLFNQAFFSSVALAKEQQRSSAVEASEEPVALAKEQQSSSAVEAPGEPVAGAISVDGLGIAITPMEGWSAEKGHTMSLVLMPPKDPKIVYDKVTYRPNLTVVAMHDPAPIDEKEVGELKKLLKKQIEQGAGTTSVSIDSHSFFDFTQTSKGLAVYTSFTYGEAEMSQLHMYVSGELNRFLLTYTDLASKFQDEAHMNNVWEMMTSLEVIGSPPSRYGTLIGVGGGVSLLIGVFGGLVVLRRRKAHRELSAFDSYLASDMELDEDYSVPRQEVWDMELPKTKISKPIAKSGKGSVPESSVSAMSSLTPVSSMSFVSEY